MLLLPLFCCSCASLKFKMICAVEHAKISLPLAIKRWSRFDAGPPRSGKEIKARAYIRGNMVLL